MKASVLKRAQQPEGNFKRRIGVRRQIKGKETAALAKLDRARPARSRVSILAPVRPRGAARRRISARRPWPRGQGVGQRARKTGADCDDRSESRRARRAEHRGRRQRIPHQPLKAAPLSQASRQEQDRENRARQPKLRTIRTSTGSPLPALITVAKFERRPGPASMRPVKRAAVRTAKPHNENSLSFLLYRGP